MTIKRPFYKKIWFWLICTIAFFAILGSYYGLNQQPVEGQISEFNQTDDIYIHFIDVGQADCIFIDAGEYDILIDAGNRSDGQLVVDYLQSLQTDDIELIIATHPHEDHIGGMVDVLNAYNVDLIFKPGISSIETKTSENFEMKITENNIETIIPSFEQQFVFGDVIITILSDKNNIYEETNDFSIVCRIDYGQTSFIFTGDAESPVEHDIIDSQIDLKADVLKIGHHGGATSTTAQFLYKVSPDYAIISVGQDNKYGHPDELIINRLQTQGVNILRTDLQGSIIAKSDGLTVSFVNEKNVFPTTTPINNQPILDVTIIELDKKGERVVIINNENETVDLTDWYLLSTKGEQIFIFPAGFKLDAGEEVIIAGYGLRDTGDFIFEDGSGVWNNKENDDAILFDNNRNEVSYFDDGM